MCGTIDPGHTYYDYLVLLAKSSMTVSFTRMVTRCRVTRLGRLMLPSLHGHASVLIGRCVIFLDRAKPDAMPHGTPRDPPSSALLSHDSSRSKRISKDVLSPS
jgi:hypothetical protein